MCKFYEDKKIRGYGLQNRVNRRGEEEGITGA